MIGPLGEGLQQRLQGLRVPVEHQAERAVGEQPGRVGPVTRCLGVPDGLDRLALLEEPRGGAAVQCRHGFGPCPAQLKAQEIGEEMVVAEPRAMGVERDDEGVGVLDLEQDPFRAGPSGQQIAELTVDLVEQGSTQQQVLDVLELAFQHFGDQVFGDRAVVSGELRDEPFWVRVVGQRENRQPQTCGPPFGPLVQQCRGRIGKGDSGDVEQLAGLPLGVAQIRRPDLGELARQAQPMQVQPQVTTGGHTACALAGRFVSRRVSWARASGQFSSCRSSITRTMSPSASASSASTRSTTARPLKAGVAAGGSAVLAASVTRRTELSRPSQNCWASRSSRFTATTAGRWRRPDRSAQADNSEVFPLPAGAEMIVTFRVTARSNAATRSARSISPGFPEPRSGACPEANARGPTSGDTVHSVAAPRSCCQCARIAGIRRKSATPSRQWGSRRRP